MAASAWKAPLSSHLRRVASSPYVQCSSLHRFGSVKSIASHLSESSTHQRCFRLSAQTNNNWSNHSTTTNNSNCDDSYAQVVEDTFSLLTRKAKTWHRLRHLVDLACTDYDTSTGEEAAIQTVADVGCDHGLLAIGLAISGRFRKVTGVDVSKQALQNGAISLQKELVESTTLQNTIHPTKVEFRVGDGLQVLKPGEADAICIAGMGVHTMIRILCHNHDMLHNLNSKILLLQPTNSKPRNLGTLYESLQSLGWSVHQERIVKVSSRWYISTCFVKFQETEEEGVVTNAVAENTLQKENWTVPGETLMKLEESNPMKDVYLEYVHHHTCWLRNDLKVSGDLYEMEKRWLEAHAIINEP